MPPRVGGYVDHQARRGAHAKSPPDSQAGSGGLRCSRTAAQLGQLGVHQPQPGEQRLDAGLQVCRFPLGAVRDHQAQMLRRQGPFQSDKSALQFIALCVQFTYAGNLANLRPARTQAN